MVSSTCPLQNLQKLTRASPRALKTGHYCTGPYVEAYTDYGNNDWHYINDMGLEDVTIRCLHPYVSYGPNEPDYSGDNSNLINIKWMVFPGANMWPYNQMTCGVNYPYEYVDTYLDTEAYPSSCASSDDFIWRVPECPENDFNYCWSQGAIWADYLRSGDFDAGDFSYDDSVMDHKGDLDFGAATNGSDNDYDQSPVQYFTNYPMGSFLVGLYDSQSSGGEGEASYEDFASYYGEGGDGDNMCLVWRFYTQDGYDSVCDRSKGGGSSDKDIFDTTEEEYYWVQTPLSQLVASYDDSDPEGYSGGLCYNTVGEDDSCYGPYMLLNGIDGTPWDSSNGQMPVTCAFMAVMPCYET